MAFTSLRTECVRPLAFGQMHCCFILSSSFAPVLGDLLLQHSGRQAFYAGLCCSQQCALNSSQAPGLSSVYPLCCMSGNK